MSENYIPQNLLRIRSAKGLSQTDIAELAGLSLTSYRKIESGASVPKVSTLQNIAQVLKIKLQELLQPVRSLKAVRFRALNQINNREQILADVARWLDDFTDLENCIKERFQYSLNDITAEIIAKKMPPQEAAQAARKAMGLNQDEPIRDICGLMESNGIKIYPITLANDSFFGLSIGKEDGGPAIVVNTWDRISVERWIFTAAHELGHLLLHLEAYDVNQTDEKQDQEEEANIFASYFLMPDTVFLKEWNEASGLSFRDRVIKVKRMFRVSYQTVLVRISKDKPEWRQLMEKFQSEHCKTTGKMLQRRDEPEPIGPSNFPAMPPEKLKAREPENLARFDFVEDRLSSLVRKAIENELITIGRGAEILRLDLSEMRELANSW